MLDKGLKFKTNDVKEWLDCGNPAATVETCGRVLELKSAKNGIYELSEELLDEYWKKQFEDYYIGSRGFDEAVMNYLLWGFSLKKL